MRVVQEHLEGDRGETVNTDCSSKEDKTKNSRLKEVFFLLIFS